jgi:glutaredoxin
MSPRRACPPVLGILSATVAAAITLAACSVAAQTLYKVTAADGTVTYTDRPPVLAGPRVEPVGRPDADSGGPPLPAALREPVARFPVVLYTMPDCVPCDRARDLLRQRGVPFQERVADPDHDRDAWLRAVGSLEAPAMTVGAQALRGFSAADWQSTLDLAGYPRASRLPPGYPAAPVTPLVARRTAEPAPAAAEDAPEPPRTPAASTGSGIRF